MPKQNTPRDSEIVYGLRACLAVFASRREDISRVVFSPAVRREMDKIEEWAESAEGARVSIAELADRDVARVAESEHHEGVCMLTKPRAFVPPQALADTLAKNRGAAIALDRVRNPYNVGAVLRSAAFFGLDAVIIGALAPQPALSPQAVRVAEGGAEHIALCRTTDLADTLSRFRARGVRVVGADGAAPKKMQDASFARPMVVVMGNEREGLAERVRAQCDEMIALSGSGTIESLNVAVAAGLFISRLAARA